jgi:hypothetical protein
MIVQLLTYRCVMNVESAEDEDEEPDSGSGLGGLMDEVRLLEHLVVSVTTG